MKPISITSIQWQLYRLYARASLVALLALALLCALILWFMLAYRPLMQSIAPLQLATQIKQAQAPAATAGDTLARFKQQFPDIATRPSKVDQLMQMIAEQGVQIDEVRYQTDASENPLLSRYRVTFSAQTNYTNMHHLLNAVLVQMPFVAIDTLTFRRENVQDALVDVEVSLLFYFKKS